MIKKAFLSVVFIILLGFLPFFIFAQDNQQASDLQKKITEYQNKLTELRQEKNTLSSQIQYMDTQIYLTGLQIQATEQKITLTTKEIDILGSRIEGLDESLNRVSKLLINKVVDGYKNRTFNLFSILFDSQNADDLLTRIKYIKAARDNNQKLLLQVQEAKLNYEEQKILREEKKKELDNLKAGLAKQKTDLDNQKISKQKLLIDTQNNEKIYQQRLADAQRELTQVQAAASVLQDATPIQVKKGEYIGTQGNTGYSFGDHLHYGVYNYSSIDQISGGNWYYGNWVDPSEVLSSRTVNWDTGCESSSSRTVGNGNFEWPMEPSEISQGSGITCYSNIYYRGNPHPAWDMWGPVGTAIRASEEGKAYFCRNCLGDGGNGVFIFHPNGKMTLYWHLQ